MTLKNEIKSRQKNLIEKLGSTGAAIFFAAKNLYRTGDTEYPFRQNSDFYYMTGYPECDAVAVFLPGRAEGQYVLFNLPKDPTQEIWTGHRVGQEEAANLFGVDQAFPISQLNNVMPDLLNGRETIFYPMGYCTRWDKKIQLWRNKVKAKYRRDNQYIISLMTTDSIVHEMRLIKSPEELAIIRKACEISVAAHLQAIKCCRPGMYEYELEAELLREFVRHGSRFPAYSSIVGSGSNTCILHYHDNNRQIENGDLVLIDAGAEYHCYASDITRTFPANGKFTPEQKSIYEIVLAAQRAGIETARPGNSFEQIQERIVLTLTQGLVDLGLLKGNVTSLVEQKAYSSFYMHNSGHWLGLDTHDVGNYKKAQKSRLLEVGMVLTVEPGLYLSESNPAVPDRFKNIGIRIEDDVFISESGPDVLTHSLPKEIDEIEGLKKAI